VSALPSANRLRQSSEFKSLFKSGKKVNGRGFTLFFLKSTLHQGRLGLAVSRKVANAVGRNRLKRQIRQSFRQHCQESAMDVVVIAKRQAATMTNPQIVSELQQQWQRLERQLSK
jgi:ribonuclease P protein component